jgi:signal transduction histidine kinase/CheY-like chemotaxis protein
VKNDISPASSNTYTRAGHPWAIALLRSLLETLSSRPAEKLRRAQLTGILTHSSTASVISTTFALILAVYLYPVFGVAAYIWFGLKVAAALPRFLLGQAFRYDLWTPGLGALGVFVWASLAIDGLVWGLAGVWGASAHGETVALLVACLASVAMLATFALQVQLGAAVAYVFPMLIPVVAALIFRGDALGFFAAGGMALVLIQTVVTSRASERRMTREFVAREDLATALEEVKRQSLVKTLFLGTMSHELRTPLHGILGLAELIEREATDSKTTHHLRLIRSSGSHLLELIGALLDVSRIDSGKLELHLSPIDLAAEIKNLADLYGTRATTKGISFETKLELGDTCWVQGDGTRVRQILHNLLGNAIKFTRRGVVSIAARESAGAFVFEVVDTGPGIESKDLPHIFEAFRQADDSATRPSEGAGLGLTIARELAQAMNGALEAESTMGVGSRFTLTIRPRKLRLSEVPASARLPSEPQRLRSSFHVLLVEDNDVNALIAEAYLGRLGVRITRVHDGRQAVQASFGPSRPDLILMDCRMPVLDGASATREFRAVEKSTNASRTPIIALTATPGEDDREECFAAGMDGFLTKPFTDAQLLKAIHAYIHDAKDERMREHPLYALAVSLEDTDAGLVDEVTRTMH